MRIHTYVFVVALFATSALLAGPVRADPPTPVNPWTRSLTTSTHDIVAQLPPAGTGTDPILTGWAPVARPTPVTVVSPAVRQRPLPVEHRLGDADCTCVYDAPLPSVGDPVAWAIGAPNGCARPCKELPGYDQLMNHLTTLTLAPAAPAAPVLSPLTAATGVGPWRCSDKTGTYSTGDFFIGCEDALRFEQYVYCNADCGCQADLENTVSKAGCPSHHTNCGTTCSCFDGNNWNPFAQGCDCDGLADPDCKLLYDSYHRCIDLDHMGFHNDPKCNENFQGLLNELNCVAHDGVGLNPGNYNFPPASCGLAHGCDVSKLNTSGSSGILCPGVATGTSVHP